LEEIGWQGDAVDISQLYTLPISMGRSGTWYMIDGPHENRLLLQQSLTWLGIALRLRP